MTNAPHPILFLSGAGLSPWVWEEVRARVNAESVVAPRPVAHAEAPLSAYAEAAIEAAPEGRFAIVAHSSGGVVGCEVERLVPGRVAAFFAISAVIPAPGGSFVSSMPIPDRWILGVAMRLAGTRPPASAIRRGLGTGLGENMVERLVAEFTPESTGLYRGRIGHQAWTCRRGFLLTTADKQVVPRLQHRFAKRLGVERPTEIATGHLPMLQDPVSTAATIDRFLAE